MPIAVGGSLRRLHQQGHDIRRADLDALAVHVALVELAQGIWTMVIWLAVWSVVWLPPILLIWWLVKREQRKMAARYNQPG